MRSCAMPLIGVWRDGSWSVCGLEFGLIEEKGRNPSISIEQRKENQYHQ